MSDPEPAAARTKKRSKLPLVAGVVSALALGGAGFYATWSGLLFGTPGDAHAEVAPDDLPDIAFVPMEPVVISIGPLSRNQHLRFSGQLEVAKGRTEEVTRLMPRILDVLNGYLRAVEVAQFDDPAALVRIRAQVLRRVQIVTGEGRVRDLLITEFVMN